MNSHVSGNEIVTSNFGAAPRNIATVAKNIVCLLLTVKKYHTENLWGGIHPLRHLMVIYGYDNRSKHYMTCDGHEMLCTIPVGDMICYGHDMLWTTRYGMTGYGCDIVRNDWLWM